ncbi:MAG: L-2-hydroxyglutarate oxidase [SAR324 cluster bacterium]|nr:L-2-hydroxyglutarate oxidase [SAR324 cluster bacterium]
MKDHQSNILIIGAGVIGLAIARELKERNPEQSITLIEKEPHLAFHGSGRNSGVLHAGFYYTANSLKAQFTRDGNRLLHAYCQEKNIRVNPCQKVVVAQNEEELAGLHELESRGKVNGVDVRLIDLNELAEIDPNVQTYQKALFSPTTATVDPAEVCRAIQKDLEAQRVEILFNESYARRMDDHTIQTVSGRRYQAEKIINCAGLYADKVAKDFGFSQDYTIIPFKGIYLKYTKPDQPIRTCIYPVPNLKNPFLGVHYTITVDNTIKIGPTAIPAFWRENYQKFDRFDMNEFLEILYQEARLFAANAFNFRALAFEEVQKYYKPYFVGLATSMVKQIDTKGFTEWSKPGIRAQLLNTKTMALVQDFVVEGDEKTIHVLNAVSPAFTCSFPFAKWVVERYIATP